ncbi:hypothetical protein [Paraburkholderia sp. BL23I1N1]|uniref:hypothetical protein n=1 Tax=Paraburkholderia sp. BL23I1N1 TaxID=1938802 RepID=UPI000E74670A|nr:hypothetical protein [Paraburkholderia sp. BL23I1N1]
MESTFTIGFLNDLILITATRDQNFSAIAPGVTFPYKSIWPHDGFHGHYIHSARIRLGARVAGLAAALAAAQFHN